MHLFIILCVVSCCMALYHNTYDRHKVEMKSYLYTAVYSIMWVVPLFDVSPNVGSFVRYYYKHAMQGQLLLPCEFIICSFLRKYWPNHCVIHKGITSIHLLHVINITLLIPVGNSARKNMCVYHKKVL